jgi:hypothetical protein
MFTSTLKTNKKVSFIMSYTYNGSEIQIAHPVQTISINNLQVIFADSQGQKSTKFDTKSQARQFVKWLKVN